MESIVEEAQRSIATPQPAEARMGFGIGSKLIRSFSLPVLLACSFLFATLVAALEPIPDRLVVLTFDDSVKSHYTVARPILKKYGFGATFFITEGFTFKKNKKDYMTWEEIRELHRAGFEIGNHTRDHMGVRVRNLPCSAACTASRQTETSDLNAALAASVSLLLSKTGKGARLSK